MTQRSVATASRDRALVRRMSVQFLKMFGREFKPGEDFILWTRDLSHYGFSTRESVGAGYRKPVGTFPFGTSDILIAEEAYCGFTPEFWHQTHNSRELLTASSSGVHGNGLYWDFDSTKLTVPGRKQFNHDQQQGSAFWILGGFSRCAGLLIVLA